MSRKLFCLAVAVVVVGTICLSAYLASAGPPGPFNEPPGFENGNQSEKAEEAIEVHKPITPGGHYERLVLVHYGREDKPPKPPKPDKPGKPDEEEPEDPNNDDYELLGLWWTVPGDPEPGIPYVIDDDYAPEGSVVEIEAAFEAWDDATSTELFATPAVNTEEGPSLDEPDYVNTVSWRRIVPPRVIAATFIWSDPKTGEMVDCDVVMNTNKKDWGIGGIEDAFDVRNIVTHEAGHVVGLADLYDDIYRELTMYGYSSKGETQKISLGNGDVLGCQELYGE